MSTLYGIKIWDDNGVSYYTSVNISQEATHNRPTESVVTYYSKFPYVISDGAANYWSGSGAGCFADNSEECDDDYDFSTKSVLFQLEFAEWLHNGTTKYLQLSENFVVPIGILEEINYSTEESFDDVEDSTVTFNWVQVAERTTASSFSHIKCSACNRQVAPTATYCPYCGEYLGT